MSGSDVAHGLAKRNRSIEVESKSTILEPKPIAHARSRRWTYPVILRLKAKKARTVGDVTLIVQIMNEATYFAAFVTTQITD